MLNLALVGLLAGSLVTAAPDGDKDKDKDRSQIPPAPEAVATEATPEAAPVLLRADETAADPRTIVADTYPFGRSADEAPFKLWVHYGRGSVENYFDFQGNTQEIVLGGTNGHFIRQTIGVGAHIDFLNFSAFKVGAGAQLNVSQVDFNPDAGAGGAFAAGLSSPFGLQGVKVYGQLQGRVLGIHGGYHFDLGNEQTFATPGVPNNLSNSDERNAINVGADFDYPSERFRLFGGVDFYSFDNGPTFRDGSVGEDDLLYFTMGAGLRFSIFELGAALGLRTQFKNGPLNATAAGRTVAGGHIGFVNPYLRISPGFFPASLFVKTGTINEYTEYGFPIGGANEFKPTFGFTAGLTVGFN